ncbi:E3 ubiquitin-protein ligase SIAH2 isoform X2 [Ahaetulla prasina]|uniref:E3 ubiquitin-protein ligase SIAH2 isoform X2 n=1 Tax=Ahaetulla prasina TaxID=499056 RepID=UPI002649EC72|nr:E3 ubiquitin-protein ligase SIAH2 isoform X2 [Ahaetulla prasina]
MPAEAELLPHMPGILDPQHQELSDGESGLGSPLPLQETCCVILDQLCLSTASQVYCWNSQRKETAMVLKEKLNGHQAKKSVYATTGCSLTLHHTEKPDHEDICEYRPYSCPCPGASCKWQGSLEAVMSHLMHAHKSITTLQGEDIVFLATDINLPGAVDWVMMQSCFGHHFMLVLEKQEKYEGHQQFFAIVLLIGTRKQAENFAYRLELNGNRRRLTWEATPRSIHDGVAAAIMNSDCLVFDTAIAHLFADNGNLGINVTISTCCP